MKNKSESAAGLQELCRKLKLQLEELTVPVESEPPDREAESRRTKLMERLKEQLAELS